MVRLFGGRSTCLFLFTKHLSLSRISLKKESKILQEIKKYRNENIIIRSEILTPITGRDHSYALLSTYEGLAEMELQNKKMFEDEEYTKLIGEFFLEAIVQGSMNTQLYRTMSGKKDKL